MRRITATSTSKRLPFHIYALSLFLAILLQPPSKSLLCVHGLIHPTPHFWSPSSSSHTRNENKQTLSKHPPPPHNSIQRRTNNNNIRYSTTTNQKDPTSSTYTIQILMSDTGGGHRASANALRDALTEIQKSSSNNNIECDIVDIYTEYGPFWPLNAYPAMYKIMAEYSFLWKAFYEFGETDFGLWLNDFLLELFCFDSFKECIQRPQPSTNKRADMIVSVHPLCQDLPLKILNHIDSNGLSREKGRTTPFVTVVTDLGGAHPTWFNPGVDKCYVPTDALYQLARNRNVQAEQIVQYGLPIRKGFWSIPSPNDDAEKQDEEKKGFIRNLFSSSSSSESSSNSKQELQIKLGLQPSIPTALIVGGGDGMGGIIDQALALGDQLGENDNDMKYQMVVVCGKNQKAKETLEKVEWKGGLVVVQIMGFVNNMEEWMRASDVLVTKAGPGTIAEASICGLPCMLSSFLPGQEEGNVPHVENGGFGKYSGDPRIIAETVRSWLSSPKKMEEMRLAALKASRPSATLDIARDLADMLLDHHQG